MYKHNIYLHIIKAQKYNNYFNREVLLCIFMVFYLKYMTEI